MARSAFISGTSCGVSDLRVHYQVPERMQGRGQTVDGLDRK